MFHCSDGVVDTVHPEIERKRSFDGYPRIMTAPTLADLRKALGLLEKVNAAKQEDISAHLRHGKAVTQDEEEWLDGAGNMVDERLLVDELGKAADFGVALANLNPRQ